MQTKMSKLRVCCDIRYVEFDRQLLIPVYLLLHTKHEQQIMLIIIVPSLGTIKMQNCGIKSKNSVHYIIQSVFHYDKFSEVEL